MADILEQIVADKRQELATRDFSFLASALEGELRETNSMRQALAQSSHGVIAEFKRRSPSKGWINEEAKVQDVVHGYINKGAACSSILTNTPYFGGSPEDLVQARALDDCFPLLRKEFIIAPEQIQEARILGADAILLIASCLSVKACKELAQVAHDLDLEVLLEVHHEQELGHLNEYIDMLGVNNRNLGSFDTDIKRSFDMAQVLQKEAPGLLLVSESGISQPETIKALREVGYAGFLIGETFMSHEDPAIALHALLDNL